MKEIPNHPLYFANSNGKIYRQKGKSFRQLTQIIQPYGKYLSVYIIDSKGEKTLKQVHKLVASAYFNIDPIEYTITHIDGNLLNNKPSNLKVSKIETNNNENELKNKKKLIEDFEKKFLKKINNDFENPLWKQYEKVKEKKNYKNIYNWLYVHIK
ncbi:MAG: HNH endonuclease [Ignavibacteria bacterium]|nr:HNH endonuclease [Ignavibacteria bacterium]